MKWWIGFALAAAWMGGSALAGEGMTVLELGDSITAGGNGDPTYREFLAPELAKKGVTLIGPVKDAISAHAGFGGKNSGLLLEKTPGIYQKYPADFVLLHSGHNHFTKDQPVPQILKDTEAIVRHVHRAKPTAYVLVGQMIPSGKHTKVCLPPRFESGVGRLGGAAQQGRVADCTGQLGWWLRLEDRRQGRQGASECAGGAEDGDGVDGGVGTSVEQDALSDFCPFGHCLL